MTSQRTFEPAELLAVVTRELEGRPAWLVGGAVRDELLGRPVVDFDVAVAGDVAQAAKRVARTLGGHPFSLSDAFGTWRVTSRDRDWQIDLVRLAGDDIFDD